MNDKARSITEVGEVEECRYVGVFKTKSESSMAIIASCPKQTLFYRSYYEHSSPPKQDNAYNYSAYKL